MKYAVIAVLAFILGIVVDRQFLHKEDEPQDISLLVQNSINQVSKLVVTEAKYSEVFTRTNSDNYLWDMVKFEKKAVIMGNVLAEVSYDLQQMKYDVDDQNKIIIITSLPEPKVDYHYDFQWYDVEQSRMNQFTRNELGKIQEEAKKKVRANINENALKKQAHARLIEELERMWAGLSAYGWKIEDRSLADVKMQTKNKN